MHEHAAHGPRGRREEDVVDRAAEGGLDLLHQREWHLRPCADHTPRTQAWVALASAKLERRSRVAGEHGHECAVQNAVDEDPEAPRRGEEERRRRPGGCGQRSCSGRKQSALATLPKPGRAAWLTPAGWIDGVGVCAIKGAQKHLEHGDAVGNEVVHAHKDDRAGGCVCKRDEDHAPEGARPVPRLREGVPHKVGKHVRRG
mmetsp:Transcript_17276/g.53592  ORF Transcript_17276/g.53592 Transcript_17276/m.53592 type:complete len:201 (+) Transcript_17276:982-1584(+)